MQLEMIREKKILCQNPVLHSFLGWIHQTRSLSEAAALSAQARSVLPMLAANNPALARSPTMAVAGAPIVMSPGRGAAGQQSQMLNLQSQFNAAVASSNAAAVAAQQAAILQQQQQQAAEYQQLLLRCVNEKFIVPSIPFFNRP